jgi:hypothetical protein
MKDWYYTDAHGRVRGPFRSAFVAEHMKLYDDAGTVRRPGGARRGLWVALLLSSLCLLAR